MGSQIRPLYAFGPFRVDPVERVLWQNDQAVPLAPKIFDTLLVLVENSGHIVEKERLMQKVWPDTFVEQGNLTLNISTLRKLLGESSKDHHYIETIPRRGYRFVAYVRDSSDESVDLVVEERTRLRIISDAKEEIHKMPQNPASIRYLSRAEGATEEQTGGPAQSLLLPP